jgi:hypothetical protein
MNPDKQQAAADELVRNARALRVPVAGLSMGRKWAEAAAVQVTGILHRTPRLGDVVLARTPTGRIVHRVIWRRFRAGRHLWLTLGDGNATFDDWLEDDAVLGVVTSVENSGGVARPVRRWSGLLRGWGRLLARQAGR